MKQKLKRGHVNYIIDIIIGAAFLLSILSGIFLLLLPSGEGFRGGRNQGFTSTVLGMDRWLIKDIHNVSSIAMALGVLGHFILHWNWIVCMTRNLFKTGKRKPEIKCEVQA